MGNKNPVATESERDLTGRELDALIARQVFGVTKIFYPRNYKSGEDVWGSVNDPHFIKSGKSPRTHMIDAKPVPYFSTDIAAAMEVVEKLRTAGWSFACTLYEGKLPYASFCKLTAASSRNAEAKSLPEAICLAALQTTKQ